MIPRARTEPGPFGGPASGLHYTPVLDTQTAKQIAMHLHEGQRDKAGLPYWRHVVAVGDMVRLLGGTDEEIVAGYFHDAVEDDRTTLEALRDLGATDYTLSIVEALSKRKGEANEVSLRRVVNGGHGSCLVKAADLLHNTRRDRVEALRAMPGADPRRIDERLRTYSHWMATVLSHLGLLPGVTSSTGGAQ